MRGDDDLYSAIGLCLVLILIFLILGIAGS